MGNACSSDGVVAASLWRGLAIKRLWRSLHGPSLCWILTGAPCVRNCRLRLNLLAGRSKMAGMNASDQARSLELAQAIASAAVLFRGHFPDARANLTPWRDDPVTRAWAETESVDLSFHFPGWNPRNQCRSMLVQLRLDAAPALGRPRLLGVVIRGLTYDSERWRLATVGDWQPSGSHLPQPAVIERLQQVCRELFALFDRRTTQADDQAA
jgi:hypothetical protein